MTPIEAAVGIGLVGIAIIVAVVLVNLYITLRRRITLPPLHLIFDGLEGSIIELIGHINRAVIETFEKTGRWLTDEQRFQLALAWYDQLPNFIDIAGRSYPIGWLKTIVTRDVWANWIKSNYGRLKRDFKQNATWIATQIENLAKDLDAIDGTIEFTNKLRVGGSAYANADGVGVYNDLPPAGAILGSLVFGQRVFVNEIVGDYARVSGYTSGDLSGWVGKAFLSAAPLVTAPIKLSGNRFQIAPEADAAPAEAQEPVNTSIAPDYEERLNALNKFSSASG